MRLAANAGIVDSSAVTYTSLPYLLRSLQNGHSACLASLVPFYGARPYPCPRRPDLRAAACGLGRQCHQDRRPARGWRGTARRPAPGRRLPEFASQQAGDLAEPEGPEIG